MKVKKKSAQSCALFFYSGVKLSVFCFLHDSLESLGLVHGEVGKHLAVDDDTCFVQSTHELAVRETFETSGCVDTLNPKSAERAFFVLTVAVSVLQTFLPSVLGYGPDIAASAEIASGEAHHLFSTVARSNMIY